MTALAMRSALLLEVSDAAATIRNRPSTVPEDGRGGKKVLASKVSGALNPVQTFLDVATILLPLAYLLVAIDYGFLFFSSHPVAERTATPALRGTVLLHLAFLAAASVQWRQFPAATVSQALSVVAFAV